MSDNAEPQSHLTAVRGARFFVLVDEYATSFVKAHGYEHARQIHYLRDGHPLVSIAELPMTLASRMDVPHSDLSIGASWPTGDNEDPHARGCGVIYRTYHVRPEEIPAVQRGRRQAEG